MLRFRDHTHLDTRHSVGKNSSQIVIINRRVHQVKTASLTISTYRKRSIVVGRSLNRHVGLKVATHVWKCMPRQMLICCVVLVLAEMWPYLLTTPPSLSTSIEYGGGGMNLQLKVMLKKVWNNLMFLYSLKEECRETKYTSLSITFSCER